jgi:hypothetical protein
MTAAQAFALIKDSAPYKAGGNIEAAWIRWRAANPGEATKLLAYLDARVRGQNPAPPKLATKFGAGALAVLLKATDLVVEPQPEPPPSPPAPSFWDQHFAIVITAGNADPFTLWASGVRAVAFADNPENRVLAQHASWAVFKRGLFVVTRATTDAGLKDEATSFAFAHQPPVEFMVVDTENLKADAPNQDRFALQQVFYDELRRLAPAKLIANITYGWHQDATVVNREALTANNIADWWEAYDGDAASWDTRAVTEKLNAQGHKPARICLGDKRLEEQVSVWKQLVAEGKAARGAMLWAVDNGPAQESLRAGVTLT